MQEYLAPPRLYQIHQRFQFALILVSVCLTVPAYRLAQGADRLDRQRHGLPAEPPPDREVPR